MQPKKAFVTGSTGFVGFSVVKSLIENGQKQIKKYNWEKMARETLAIYNNCT